MRSDDQHWLARDPGRLAGSLGDYAGHPPYGIGQQRQDQERFVFLFGPAP